MLTEQQKQELRAQYNPDGSKLRNLQLNLLDVIVAFDAFCRENDIKYSLHAGTLLGAVRHGGFIPWDDDVDLALTREQYNKLLSLRNKNDLLNDKLYLWTIGQIGMLSLGNGFIDVMIVDNVPNGKLFRETKRILCIIMFLILKAHNYYDRRWKTNFKLWMLLIPIALCFPQRKLYTAYQWLAQLGNNNLTPRKGIYTDVLADIGTDFDRTLFDSYCDIKFEGKTCMCIQKYEQLLKRYYGDYMKLPDKILKHNRG